MSRTRRVFSLASSANSAGSVSDSKASRVLPGAMASRYQIRNALRARNASGDTAPVNFSPFEAAYQVLTDKLRPQVFTLGFLR